MTAFWKPPPKIKIYEALGALADGRVKVKINSAQVTSSSGRKEYKVEFDPKANALTSNDNGSYWQGYLGYPAIAFLMKKNFLAYEQRTSALLQDIPWKKINDETKHNYQKTENEVRDIVQARGGDIEKISKEIETILLALAALKLARLKNFKRPPKE